MKNTDQQLAELRAKVENGTKVSEAEILEAFTDEYVLSIDSDGNLKRISSTQLATRDQQAAAANGFTLFANEAAANTYFTNNPPAEDVLFKYTDAAAPKAEFYRRASDNTTQELAPAGLTDADTTGDIDDQQGDKLAKAVAVWEGYQKFLNSEAKDPFFENISTTGNWKMLTGAVPTREKDYIVSQDSAYKVVAQEIPVNLTNESYYISFQIYIPAGYTNTSSVFGLLAFNASNANYTIAGLPPTSEGWNTVILKGKVNENQPGGFGEITKLRVDLRMRAAGVRFRQSVSLVLKEHADLLIELGEKFAETNPDELEKLNNLTYENYWQNAATQDTSNYETAGQTKTVNGTDIRLQQSITSPTFAFFNFDIDTPWLANHKYYVVFDVTVDACSQNVDGNFTPSIRPKKSNPETIGSSVVRQNLLVGSRGFVKLEITIDETISVSDPTKLFFQFSGFQFQSGDEIDVTFHNVLIVDMGEIGSNSLKSYDEVDAYFSEYGFTNNLKLITTPVKNSTSAGNGSIALADIQLTGDSLAAQNPLADYASANNRTIFVQGYGGRKSNYIRDQFLASLTEISKQRTHVFYTGRNNYSAPDQVIQDIKVMVNAIEHNRFVIATPPNGGYANDLGSNTSRYALFLYLEEQLSLAYPSNYVNTRLALINRFDWGGVRLTGSFTQPAINGTVQVNFTDGNYLTSENASDAGAFPDYSGKIRIGTPYNDFEKTDLYEVVSQDSSTQLTLRLLENGSDYLPGDTVQNETVDEAFYYQYVMKEQDVFCVKEKTVPSSLRSDGVHANAAGLKLWSDIIGAKLEAMKI